MIQIGGINYKINQVEADSHELVSGTTIGHIYYDKDLIVLAENLTDNRKAQTFVHELTHAVFLAMGYHGNEEVILDEKFVDSFSSYLHQIIEQL